MPVHEFAIYENNVIENIILAESKTVAESVTNKKAIRSVNGKPGIGWKLEENEWRSEKTFDSWIWNSELQEWTAPIPKPDPNKSYVWNEEDVKWDIPPQPFPSWTINENNQWIPPKPLPNEDDIFDWDEDSQEWVLLHKKEDLNFN